jgi:hypothetical protein
MFRNCSRLVSTIGEIGISPASLVLLKAKNKARRSKNTFLRQYNNVSLCSKLPHLTTLTTAHHHHHHHHQSSSPIILMCAPCDDSSTSSASTTSNDILSQQALASQQSHQQHYPYYSQKVQVERRSVSFSDNQEVREIPAISEDCSLWITRREFKSYKREMLKTAEAIKTMQTKTKPTTSTTDIDDQVCLRGMESLLDKGRSSGRRRTARKAVLKIQSIQRGMSIKSRHQDRQGQDTDLIAKIYISYTKSSLDAARLNAVQDQHELTLSAC